MFECGQPIIDKKQPCPKCGSIYLVYITEFGCVDRERGLVCRRCGHAYDLYLGTYEDEESRVESDPKPDKWRPEDIDPRWD